MPERWTRRTGETGRHARREEGSAKSSARVAIEPPEDLADAARRHRHAGVRRTVIEVQRIAVRSHGGATGKRDIPDVSMPLVRRFRSEDPFVPAQEQTLGMFEIK